MLFNFKKNKKSHIFLQEKKSIFDEWAKTRTAEGFGFVIDRLPNPDIILRKTGKEIFELCGAETAVSLLLKMPANLIQVPARGFINIQKRLIQKNYDGTTASLRKMARDFKIPEMTIRRILNECRVNVPAEDQLNFFEKKEEIIAE